MKHGGLYAHCYFLYVEGKKKEEEEGMQPIRTTDISSDNDMQ